MSKTIFQPVTGRRLRALRERARLTRTQLSKQTGVPVSAIARLEHGDDVRLSTYLPILNYFVKRDAHAWMLAQLIVGVSAKRRTQLLAALAANEAGHG